MADKLVKAVCKKNYVEKDFLDDFLGGNISKEELIKEIHEVGEEAMVVDKMYCKEHWQKIDSEMFKPFKGAKVMCKKCLRHWCVCNNKEN